MKVSAAQGIYPCVTRTLPSALLILTAACASEAPVERFPNAWSGAHATHPPGEGAQSSGTPLVGGPQAGLAAPTAPSLSLPSPSAARPTQPAPATSSASQKTGPLYESAPTHKDLCLCSVDRDRVHVEVPCGEAPCLDSVRVSCDGPAPGALRELGACGAESACSCSIDLPDETAIDLACGLRACVDGVSYACSAAGQAERGASCQ